MILAFLFLSLQDPQVLIEKLRAESLEERDEAHRKLKELGRPALPALEKALKDPDVEVAGRAKHLIRAIELAESISPELRKGLPGIEDRLTAGNEATWTREFLAACEAVAVRPELRAAGLDVLAVRALRGAADNDEVRDQVIDAIDAFSLTSAVPELLDLLGKDFAPSWDAAVYALRHLATRAHVPALQERLRDQGQGGKVSLLEILGETGSPEVIPLALKWAVGDGAPRKRAAINLLGDCGRTEALALLLAIDHPGVEPIEALGRIGDPKAIPRILDEFKVAPHPGIRHQGSEALARLGAREALPALIDAAAESEYRYEILRSIAWISREQGLAVCDKGLGSPSKDMRRVSLYTLGWLQARDRAPAIAKLLDDPEGDVRHNAIGALGDLGAKEYGEKIAAQLSDPTTLRTTVAALARLGLADRVPLKLLDPLLTSTEPWSQNAGIELCGMLSRKDALPLVLPHLKSEHHFLRYTAGMAVVAILGKDATETVRPLLRDPNCSVRYHVAEALVEAGVEEAVLPLLKETRDRRFPHKFGNLTSSSSRTCRAINGLRRPGEWKRLKEAPIPENMKGTRRELIEKCAGAAGLKVEWSASCADDLWLTGNYAVDLWAPPTTALEGLIHLLRGSKIQYSTRFEMILETGKLKVMPSLEAVRFWEQTVK